MDFGTALNRLRQRVPRPLREAGLRLYYAVLDRWDALRYRGGDPIPPRHRWLVGGGDFRTIGADFLGYFRTLGGLQPTDRVLDVGCGLGRMAIPLTHFLSEQGSYDGFDIIPFGIEWCRAHITARHPNFQFRLADLKSLTYNPDGAGQAASYRFPYDDAAFDFVFLTSVFTHLMPEEVRQYLSECARVLRAGGTLFATWFLLNDESVADIGQGRSSVDLRHDLGECRVAFLHTPSAAVGYQERLVRQHLAERGLAVVEPIHYGSWCGRREFLSFQDIVVATKASAPRRAPR
jgi:SAM-dependent methyltransferase